mgnify:CR=1 FL=1
MVDVSVDRLGKHVILFSVRLHHLNLVIVLLSSLILLLLDQKSF